MLDKIHGSHLEGFWRPLLSLDGGAVGVLIKSVEIRHNHRDRECEHDNTRDRRETSLLKVQG